MANSVLQRYSRALDQKVADDGVEAVSKQQEDPLAVYENAMKEKDRLEVIFEIADKDGNLYLTDPNGIKILATAKDLLDAMPYYQKRIKDKFIGKSFVVNITKVDREKKIVYVKSSRSSAGATKAIIIREIQKELNAGHKPVVNGRVTKVTDDTVYVDLLVRGILGVCTIAYWRKGYTQSLKSEVKYGDILKFEITGRMEPQKTQTGEELKKKTGAQTAFLLSRKDITSDPWKNVSPIIQPNAVCLIKCIEKPDGKTYWWGSTPLAAGIQVMCDYNDKFGIATGRTYKCKIRAYDPKKGVLKATPFESTTIGMDGEKLNNLKFLTSKKPLMKQTVK